MKDKKIEVMKNWLKLKSMKSIQVFPDFANFFWRFIQGFNKIARLFTLMLWSNGLSKNLLLLMDMAKSDDLGIISGDGNCKDEIDKGLLFKNCNETMGYLSLKARLPFIQLRKMFTKALIL